MTFIPQALADFNSKSILVVFRDELSFNTYWKDKVKTVDALGIEIHPSSVKIGDIIDVFITGWNKFGVTSIEFKPEKGDMPGIHVVGTYIFEDGAGTSYSCRVDGRYVDRVIYKFNI
jgi:hypothetical protein